MANLQPKPRWSESKKRWELCLYEGKNRVKTFSSTNFDNGYAKCLKNYKAWLAGGKKKTPNTINVIWDKYIESCKNTFCMRAIQNKNSIYNQYIKPEIGTKKANNVTVQDLQNIIDKQYKKRLAKKTLGNIRDEINSLCKFAERTGIIIVTPDLKIPKNARSKGKQIIPVAAIRELFDPKYDNYISINYFRLMMLLGCRPGEVCGLRWSDLEDGDHLKISRSINLQGEITLGKNENALRTIILSDFALSILDKQREVQAREGIVTEWMFGYEEDKQPSLHRLYKRWCGVSRGKDTKRTRGLADLLGATGTSLYSFRHTFLTMCQDANVDLTVLKPYVGHGISFDSFGVYGRTTDTLRKKATHEVDDAFKHLLSS